MKSGFTLPIVSRRATTVPLRRDQRRRPRQDDAFGRNSSRLFPFLAVFVVFACFCTSTAAASGNNNTAAMGNTSTRGATTNITATATSRAATMTPLTPAPRTACDFAVFDCNATFWQCLRGQAFKCGCLQRRQLCLGATTCMTPALLDECTVDVRRLRCADNYGCPLIADRYEDGKGWIVALTFFILSIVFFTAVLCFVGYHREWYYPVWVHAAEFAHQKCGLTRFPRPPVLDRPKSIENGRKLPKEAMDVLPPALEESMRERFHHRLRREHDLSPQRVGAEDEAFESARLAAVDPALHNEVKIQEELAALSHASMVVDEEMNRMKREIADLIERSKLEILETERGLPPSERRAAASSSLSPVAGGDGGYQPGSPRKNPIAMMLARSNAAETRFVDDTTSINNSNINSNTVTMDTRPRLERGMDESSVRRFSVPAAAGRYTGAMPEWETRSDPRDQPGPLPWRPRPVPAALVDPAPSSSSTSMGGSSSPPWAAPPWVARPAVRGGRQPPSNAYLREI